LEFGELEIDGMTEVQVFYALASTQPIVMAHGNMILVYGGAEGWLVWEVLHPEAPASIGHGL
jgi:hypothetical protein